MVEKDPAPAKMPDEVFSAIYDAAHEENRLRDLGYTQKRIGRLVGRQLDKKLIDLQLTDKLDTRLAFPPKANEEEPAIVDPQLTPQEEAMVDRLVDNGTLTYDEAIARVKNRRR